MLWPCLAFDAQDARSQLSSYLRLLKHIKVTGMRDTLASMCVVAANDVMPVASGASV